MDYTLMMITALRSNLRFDNSRTLAEAAACCAVRSGSRLFAGVRARPAIWLIGGVFAALWFFAPDQAVESAYFVARSLWGIAPLLIAAIAIVAAAKAGGFDRRVARAFAGRGASAVVAAALIGALSPFCSCGVIPLIAGLLGAGVPLPPVMAFWLASPLMDPETFIITAAQLGMGFAVAKTVAAVGMGLLGGGVAAIVIRLTGGIRVAREGSVASGCGCAKRGILTPPAPVLAFWRDGDRLRIFGSELRSGLALLAPWMAAAFLGESLMSAWLPTEAVATWLGGNGPFAVPLAVAIGVPAYLNGFAAVPLVSGLIDLGMNPAVALAFLVAGGVTSVPAMAAVFSLVRPPVFAIYLGCAATGSLLAGYLYAAVSAMG